MKRRKFIQTGTGLVASLSFPSVLRSIKQSKDKENMKFTVGFSSVNLTPCIKSKTKSRHPLQAIVASIKNEESHIILLTLDLLGIDEADWKS